MATGDGGLLVLGGGSGGPVVSLVPGRLPGLVVSVSSVVSSRIWPVQALLTGGPNQSDG